MQLQRSAALPQRDPIRAAGQLAIRQQIAMRRP